MRLILEQEDTDGNFQISVTDTGPKVMALGTLTSNGYRSFDVSSLDVCFLRIAITYADLVSLPSLIFSNVPPTVRLFL